MILKIFSVRDRQSDQYSTPMFLPATGQAVRAFTDEINRSGADNPLYNHPDDFDLWYIGSWDTTNGQFVFLQSEQVAIGKNVKLNGQS